MAHLWHRLPLLVFDISAVQPLITAFDDLPDRGGRITLPMIACRSRSKPVCSACLAKGETRACCMNAPERKWVSSNDCFSIRTYDI